MSASTGEKSDVEVVAQKSSSFGKRSAATGTRRNSPPAAVLEVGLLVAGPLAATVVGLAYYFRYPFVGLTRVILVIIYGIFAGGAFSATTQLVVPTVGRLSGRYFFIPRNIWVRTVLLCIATGMVVGAITAVFFWSLSGGPPISAQLLIFGYLLTSVFVGMSDIFREYKWEWSNFVRALGACLGVSFVHFAVGMVVVKAFQEEWYLAFRSLSNGGHPIFAGCAIGALIGGLMGSQMSLTVSAFRYWQTALVGDSL